MKTIFHRLHPHHFSRGWPVFWRMNAPFWADLAHLAASFSLSLRFQDVLLEKILKGSIFWSEHPLAPVALGAVVLYGLLWPWVWGMKQALHRWTDAGFWQAQFSLVGGLNKLSRGLTALLVAVAVFLAWGNEGVLEETALLRGVLTLFILVLVGAVVIFIGLYGWLAEQWRELSPEGHP